MTTSDTASLGSPSPREIDAAARAPRISVVIAHTRAQVDRCLASLATQTLDARQFEAVVVGSDPEHVTPGKYRFPVRYVSCAERNPSLRRNRGVAVARGAILAFLDDDAEATELWLATALALFESDRELAVVGGPTLLPEDASLSHKLTYKIAHAGFFGNGHENLARDTTDFRQLLGYIICCNMFVHRERLDRHHGFDVRVGYGGEDTLFLYQVARRNDCRILYSTAVVVRHSRGGFGPRYLASRFRYRMNNGLMLWSHPTLYLGHPKFAAGVALATALVAVTLVQPLLAVPLAALHLTLAGLYSIRYRREDWRLSVLFPPSLLLQHVTYYAGIVVGVLSVVHPAQRRRVRTIRGRLP